MTFLAEWGDRSQIATIAVAASYNLFMVIVRCLLGHFIFTTAAVQLGEWISTRVSEKQVQYAGGFVFVLSGLITLFMIFEQEPQWKKDSFCDSLSTRLYFLWAEEYGFLRRLDFLIDVSHFFW